MPLSWKIFLMLLATPSSFSSFWALFFSFAFFVRDASFSEAVGLSPFPVPSSTFLFAKPSFSFVSFSELAISFSYFMTPSAIDSFEMVSSWSPSCLSFIYFGNLI
jgi:hypothetical protein